MQTTTLYNQDFYAWAQRQVELLRSGRLGELDVDNLIEEIESLGRPEQQELRNRLVVLLGHLLKWRYQPEARSKNWAATIREQRKSIQEHLAENPSLKSYLPEAILKGYRYGLNLVDKETPLDLQQLPHPVPSLNPKSLRSRLTGCRNRASLFQ